MNNEQAAVPTGIRIIPPIAYALALAVALGLEELWPITNISLFWRIGIAVLLLAIAVPLIALTVTRFSKSATPFDVRKSATTLITTGPYRYSRNPGYVALTLLYLAIGSLLGSLWVLLLALPLLATVDRLIVRKEEINLAGTFGEEYRLYQAKVRRWL